MSEVFNPASIGSIAASDTGPDSHGSGTPHGAESGLKVYVARSYRAVSSNLEHEYLAMMPPACRASMARYVRWQDRQATLFGKLLLLRALQSSFQISWLQKFQSIEVTPYGKPHIPGGPEFNISHSGELVVVAVTETGVVRIDAEKIRPVKTEDFSRYLPEVAYLDGKHGDDQVNNIFFDCWTRKEAVLKGHGTGLSVPLEHVVINENRAFLHDTRWHITKLLLDEGHCCHVATDLPLGHVAVEYVNLQERSGRWA